MEKSQDQNILYSDQNLKADFLTATPSADVPTATTVLFM